MQTHDALCINNMIHMNAAHVALQQSLTHDFNAWIASGVVRPTPYCGTYHWGADVGTRRRLHAGALVTVHDPLTSRPSWSARKWQSAAGATGIVVGVCERSMAATLWCVWTTHGNIVMIPRDRLYSQTDLALMSGHDMAARPTIELPADNAFDAATHVSESAPGPASADVAMWRHCLRQAHIQYLGFDGHAAADAGDNHMYNDTNAKKTVRRIKCQHAHWMWSGNATRYAALAQACQQAFGQRFIKLSAPDACVAVYLTVAHAPASASHARAPIELPPGNAFDAATHAI